MKQILLSVVCVGALLIPCTVRCADPAAGSSLPNKVTPEGAARTKPAEGIEKFENTKDFQAGAKPTEETGESTNKPKDSHLPSTQELQSLEQRLKAIEKQLPAGGASTPEAEGTKGRHYIIISPTGESKVVRGWEVPVGSMDLTSPDFGQPQHRTPGVLETATTALTTTPFIGDSMILLSESERTGYQNQIKALNDALAAARETITLLQRKIADLETKTQK